MLQDWGGGSERYGSDGGPRLEPKQEQESEVHRLSGSKSRAAAAPAQVPQAQKPAAPLQLQDMGQTAKRLILFPVGSKVLYGDFAYGGYGQRFFEGAVGTTRGVSGGWRQSRRRWLQREQVVVFVSDKAPNSKVQPTASSFVTPDGKDAVAATWRFRFGVSTICGSAEGIAGSSRWRDAGAEPART